jgi:hypothetical protein
MTGFVLSKVLEATRFRGRVDAVANGCQDRPVTAETDRSTFRSRARVPAFRFDCPQTMTYFVLFRCAQSRSLMDHDSRTAEPRNPVVSDRGVDRSCAMMASLVSSGIVRGQLPRFMGAACRNG